MATTFNWIYLGTSTTQIDPTEGNNNAENASALVGQTYGSAGDPLYTHIASATMINNGGQATALDQNNNVSNDQFTTDIGAGVQTFTFDASVIYNATVTYADGTTGTVTMVLAQSTAGHLFLAPEPAAASAPDTAVYEAKPIVSVTLNSITGGTIAYLGLGIDRTVTGFDDGFVEGTAGNDLIDSAYVEPIANGSDRIDNGDGVSGAATGWQDDRVRAGAGNDTVLSGLGNDFVDGGTGADSIDGGDGADSLFGGTGAFNDTIQGGAGNDTIDGGDGNDSLLGGAGSDSILGGLGADYVDGGTEADFIDGGDGNDSLFGGAGTFNDTIIGGAGNDTIDGAAGADTLTGGANDDRFIGITAGDVVDGSEDAGNTDTDVLDLFGSGWTKANTNIIFSDPSHENGTVQFLDVNGTVIGTMTFSNIETIVPCFTPGTLIDTDRGSLPVEALRPGDRVLTMDHGYQPVRWTGHRNVTAEELLRAPQLRPILISRDTFGPGLPERDLRVSPQHRLLLSGARAELVSGETEVLAPAVHLLGLPGVVQDAAAAGVRYIHILFDQHEIVRSDGLWTESFQPARAMLSGMDGAALTELLTLFPRLGGADHEDYPCARSTIKRHEARLILAS
jgi:Ca2+-binding RTX toxin-like protein